MLHTVLFFKLWFAMFEDVSEGSEESVSLCQGKHFIFITEVFLLSRDATNVHFGKSLKLHVLLFHWIKIYFNYVS